MISEVAPKPAQRDGDPTAESDQKPDVGDRPDEPGEESADFQRAQVDDCAASPDRREMAEAAIEKIARSSSQNHLSDEPSLLLCHRCDGGEGTPGPA